MAKPPRGHLESEADYEEGLLRDGWYDGRPEKAREAMAVIAKARAPREGWLRRFIRRLRKPKGVADLTEQELFDKVLTHLREQGKPAYVRYGSDAAPKGQCRYRTDDGLKCAIGCLIPDDQYDPSFEGQSALEVLACLPGGSLFGRKAQIADKMQMALHDDLAEVDDFLDALEFSAENFARGWNLKYERPAA